MLPTMNAKIFLFVSILLVVSYGQAQPTAIAKQLLDDIEVYQDLKHNNLYYYAPGNLNLAFEADGKPKFQLVEMRYTGSSSYGDNGEKRFMNVVQFSISMEQV